MKVKHLITLLQEVDPEMEVHIYADHGQWVQKAHFAGTEYHTPEDDGYISEEDLDGWQEEYGEELNQIFLIS